MGITRWLLRAIRAPGTIGSRHLFPEKIHFTAYKIIPQSFPPELVCKVNFEVSGSATRLIGDSAPSFDLASASNGKNGAFSHLTSRNLWDDRSSL